MLYQVYVPKGEQSPNLLDNLGIADLARDSGVFYTTVMENGPDGGGGLLLDFGPPVQYHVGERTWIPCAFDKDRNLSKGRFYWGLAGGRWPLPSELERKNTVRGSLRTLGDGQEWLVPNMVALPHRLTIDDDTGDPIREVSPDWKALYEKMVWACEQCRMSVENDSELDEAKCWHYLADILAVNYRVNREIVFKMRLLTDDNWMHLMCRTIDFAKIRQIQDDLQKKRLASKQPG